MLGRWLGQGLQVVRHADAQKRRVEVLGALLGDPAKAKAQLGWSPKVSFRQLVGEMVDEDLRAAQRDEMVRREGYRIYDAHE